MTAREKQAWEIVGFMNGERIFVVMESILSKDRHGDAIAVHKILQITGKKLGRILSYTEREYEQWETQANMRRLDQ